MAGDKSKLEPHFAEAMKLLQEVDKSGKSLSEAISQAEQDVAAAQRRLETLKGLRDWKGVVRLPRATRKDKGTTRPKTAPAAVPTFEGATDEQLDSAGSAGATPQTGD